MAPDGRRALRGFDEWRARADQRLDVTDTNAWRVCIDCVISEFLTNAVVRRALAGADDAQRSIDACSSSNGHSYVIGVGIEQDRLIPLRPWAAEDLRRANALIASLDYEHSADAALFEAVMWRSQEDEAERVTRVRAAVNLMREAEASARHATETAV